MTREQRKQAMTDANLMPDARYSANLEWCGYSVPMYCVRFCDDLIGVARSPDKAAHIAATHRADFLKSIAA